MIAYLDTNYLVRYLVNDITSQAKAAKKVIENSPNLHISSIVLAETVYVLENYYHHSKAEICQPLLIILKQNNLTPPNSDIFALNIYKQENIHFYDCLLLAKALNNNGDLKTFDQALLKVFRKYQPQSPTASSG